MYVDDLRQIANEPRLHYPVATKADFVAQMTQAATVTFRGTQYSSMPAADLVPDFFFPLTSADDLVQKASELVAARGLAGAGPNPPASPHDAAHSGVRSIESIAADVEATVTNPDLPDTDPERIDALDIVTHALEFVGHPQALTLWRDAASGHYRAQTHAAVITMLEHVTTAIEQGDYDAVTKICDCLFDLYGQAPAHVGGIRLYPPAQPRDRVGANTNEGES